MLRSLRMGNHRFPSWKIFEMEAPSQDGKLAGVTTYLAIRLSDVHILAMSDWRGN